MLRIIGIVLLLLFSCFAIVIVETSGYEPHIRNGGMGMQGRIRDPDITVRKSKARDVLRYMNTSADPCIDFFEFACGKWSNFHKIKRDNELVTPISVLDQRVSKDLHDLLSASMITQETSSTHVVRNFYRSCLTVETKTTQHRDFLLNFAKNYDGLPYFAITNWNQNYNWQKVIAKLRKNYDMDILIGIEIGNEGRGTWKQNIYLSEPKTTILPAELCSEIATTNMDVKDEAYSQVQREISRNMQAWLGMRESDANRFAGDIVSFEFELCKQMRKDHTIPDEEDEEDEEETSRGRRANGVRGQNRLHGKRMGIYPRDTLQHFTQQFHGAIDFKHFLDISLNTLITSEVFMRSEAYFQHLARTVKISSKPTIANYIIYRAIAELNFLSDDRPSKRPKSCVEIMLKYFPKIVGGMYNTKMHRSEYRTDAEMLYSEVRQAFQESVKTDWLEDNTARAIIQKLAQFNLNFPVYNNQDPLDLEIENMNYWEQLEEVMRFATKEKLTSIYKGEFFSNAINIEATDTRVQLALNDNELQIGWGLLQEPIYDYFYSNAIKYSTLGHHIARELVNIVIDDQTKFRASDVEEFNIRSECLRIQYSNYLYNNPDTYRNGSKLQELMADTSALNVAFNAYLAWLQNTDPSQRILFKETLPEINYTNTQLFFISFAQGRCTAKKQGDQPPSELFPLDLHAFERYEVNGPLSNSIEYAREFGCRIGSDMHPDDKCVIF